MSTSHEKSKGLGSGRVRHAIRTGSAAIDGVLHGGVRCGTITEFFGESGSGKTQLCLQLSLYVQLPPQLGGLYGVVVYYYCDYTFPTRRLSQLRDAIERGLYVDKDIISLENVLLCKVEDCRALCYKLDELRRECTERIETPRHVRLVVVDSIASLFRSQFVNNREGMCERKMYFNTIGRKLRACADDLNLAVVIANQVTDVVDGVSAEQENISVFRSIYGQRIQPSLGSGWAGWLDSRIFLGRSNVENENDDESQPLRKLQVVFSNYMEATECGFTIRNEGVK